MLHNELIDEDGDEIRPYLMLPFLFPVHDIHLGFGGHLGLYLACH